MRTIVEGSTEWAKGAPPFIRGPWESAIIELAERGDARFVKILGDHIKAGTIRGDRAVKALEVAKNAEAA